jgi:hypothetical protein
MTHNQAQPAREAEELSDERIDAIARELFCQTMGDKEGDWGPNSLNQQWCEEIGRPFARAVAKAVSQDPIEAARKGLEAIQLFKQRWLALPPFADKVNRSIREGMTIAHMPIIELEAALRSALGQEGEATNGMPTCEQSGTREGGN